jgi:hypothetical protein
MQFGYLKFYISRYYLSCSCWQVLGLIGKLALLAHTVPQLVCRMLHSVPSVLVENTVLVPLALLHLDPARLVSTCLFSLLFLVFHFAIL